MGQKPLIASWRVYRALAAPAVMEESCLCGHRSPTRAKGQQRGAAESKQTAGRSHKTKEEEEEMKENVGEEE